MVHIQQIRKVSQFFGLKSSDKACEYYHNGPADIAFAIEKADSLHSKILVLDGGEYSPLYMVNCPTENLYSLPAEQNRYLVGLLKVKIIGQSATRCSIVLKGNRFNLGLRRKIDILSLVDFQELIGNQKYQFVEQKRGIVIGIRADLPFLRQNCFNAKITVLVVADGHVFNRIGIENVDSFLVINETAVPCPWSIKAVKNETGYSILDTANGKRFNFPLLS